MVPKIAQEVTSQALPRRAASATSVASPAIDNTMPTPWETLCAISSPADHCEGAVSVTEPG